ncbi:MAG: acetyl-CoA hydrolase/transferase C-terminal domain-containing protein [Hyphomicrobiales bacterium]
MRRRQAAHPARTITAEAAAAMVTSGMWLDYGAVLSQPDLFDRALAARVTELHDVKIRSTISTRPRAVLEADPEGRHVYMISLHFSGYDRKMHDAGRCDYLPVNLGEIDDYYARYIDPVDIIVIKTRPADSEGRFNFSAATLWHRAIIERARLVIVETSTALPHCNGVENHLLPGEVDFVIEGDNAPIFELPKPPLTDADRAVARLIAAEIEDGACLQIGIGGMPNAVCSLLLESGAGNLGIHTEMLTDGIIDLYKAGQITGAAKTLDKGKITYSFALGSRYLYDAIDGNPDFLARATSYTNLPHIIMQNDKAVSINNTTQMDLQGQAASESDGHRHISGTGGQLQFVRGSYASKGGKSFICMSSTYEKRGAPRSRIVFDLTPGNVVTTPRTDVMFVVTEYGIVNLKGKSVAQRAKAMISIAHPDFREALARQAHDHKLLPPHFSL